MYFVSMKRPDLIYALALPSVIEAFEDDEIDAEQLARIKARLLGQEIMWVGGLTPSAPTSMREGEVRMQVIRYTKMAGQIIGSVINH